MAEAGPYASLKIVPLSAGTVKPAIIEAPTAAIRIDGYKTVIVKRTSILPHFPPQKAGRDVFLPALS